MENRKEYLLLQVAKLLNKQNESGYVLNILSETIVYDGAKCDGSCLLDDILLELDIELYDLEDYEEEEGV